MPRFDTMQEIVIIGAMILGAVLLIGALILLFKERPVLDATTGRGIFSVKLPSPFNVELTSTYPAAVLLLFGMLLVGIPLWKALDSWKASDSVPRLQISGRVLLAPNVSVSGLLVGVLPTSHLTQTGADGRYSIYIPRGEKGVTYQTVVYVPGSDPPIFALGVVHLEQDGTGRFDHTLKEKRP